MTPTSNNLREACRRHLPDLPDCPFSEPPRRIVGGNETTIYTISFDVPADHSYGGSLIMRIFDSPASPPEQYLWEAATHEVLMRSGYRVPRILIAAEDPTIGTFVIMEHLNGIMMGSDGLEMPGAGAPGASRKSQPRSSPPSCGAHPASQKPVKLSRNHPYIKWL